MNATTIDVPTLAHEIASALGAQWAAHVERDDNWPAGNARVTLRDTNGRELFLYTAWNSKGRLTIDGLYGELSSYAPSQEEIERITVNARRPAAAIAKEITRRCLPIYDANVTVRRERKANHDAYEASVERSRVVMLASWPGAQRSTHNNGIYAEHAHSIQCQDGTVRFDGLTLTLPEVEALGAILRQRKA